MSVHNPPVEDFLPFLPVGLERPDGLNFEVHNFLEFKLDFISCVVHVNASDNRDADPVVIAGVGLTLDLVGFQPVSDFRPVLIAANDPLHPTW